MTSVKGHQQFPFPFPLSKKGICTPQCIPNLIESTITNRTSAVNTSEAKIEPPKKGVKESSRIRSEHGSDRWKALNAVSMAT